MEERFAVIDTETTWRDSVMSIGVAAADSRAMAPVARRYYILLPYKFHGGMFTGALYARGVEPDMECSRRRALEALRDFLDENGVKKIFAYNARFDKTHLPELGDFQWFDIMALAAYRQYNRAIPPDAECYGTGRLKHGYGVESVYRMLSGDGDYRETHNALFDAVDELAIMKMLGVDLAGYAPMD